MSAIVFYIAVTAGIWLIVAVLLLLVILPALKAASEYDDATNADEPSRHIDISYRGRPAPWLSMSCMDHHDYRR